MGSREEGQGLRFIQWSQPRRESALGSEASRERQAISDVLSSQLRDPMENDSAVMQRKLAFASGRFSTCGSFLPKMNSLPI
jgi:hypothetical protein